MVAEMNDGANDYSPRRRSFQDRPGSDVLPPVRREPHPRRRTAAVLVEPGRQTPLPPGPWADWTSTPNAGLCLKCALLTCSDNGFCPQLPAGPAPPKSPSGGGRQFPPLPPSRSISSPAWRSAALRDKFAFQRTLLPPQAAARSRLPFAARSVPAASSPRRPRFLTQPSTAGGPYSNRRPTELRLLHSRHIATPCAFSAFPERW